MTSPIGNSTTSARALIEAALKRHAETAARVHERASDVGDAAASRPAAGSSGFGAALEKGLSTVDASVADTDRLVDDVVGGRVGDIHEVALRLKQSELSFRFALEVRNKLVDAYREVMRMSV